MRLFLCRTSYTLQLALASYVLTIENLRGDDVRRTMFFNEILKFYTQDFTPTHAPSLIGYAQRYVTKKSLLAML